MKVTNRKKCGGSVGVDIGSFRGVLPWKQARRNVWRGSAQTDQRNLFGAHKTQVAKLQHKTGTK